MSKFLNSSLERVPGSGGSNRVVIPATPFQIRGGTGAGGATSVPCKECWLQAAVATTEVRVNIGAVCTATTGIHVPKVGVDFMHMRIPIDDLNKLYFIGTNIADRVDILWRE